MTKLYTYLFLCFLPFLSQAQITWDFSAATPTSGIPANITVPAITLGNNNGTSTFALLSTSSASSGYTGASGGGNAEAAARTGAYAASTSAYFEITLTPAAGVAISVSEIDFGTRSTSTGAQAYDIRSSLDNFATAVSGTIANTGTWTLKTNAITLTGAADQTITIRIYGYGGTGSPSSNTANWRIDDLAITATTAGGGTTTPTGTITVSPTSLTGFSTTSGTASGAQSITVSGSDLTDNIVLSAPTGYELSTDNTNFSSSLTLTQSGGAVSATTVWVRLTSSAAVGADNGSLILTSTGVTSQTVSLTGSVTATVPDPNANIVINQIYGGGGNSGATYKNDFVELYNNESRTVNLAGWSVQYSSATGSGWASNLTQLSGTIPAHGFFLIQMSAGTGGTVNLTSPDLAPTGSQALALSATAGKLILCNTITAQTGTNPSGANVIDKVGYGPTANGYEGAPTAAPSNTTAVLRSVDGVNTGNNANDFIVTTPLPRNSTYTTTPPTVLTLSPANGASNMQSGITLSVSFNKPVVKGSSGQITVLDNGTPTVLDISSSNITITNNNTVNIATPLTAGNTYSIEISAGALADAYGNAFAGLLSTSDWTFSIYNPATAMTLPVNFNFQYCTGTGLLPDGFTQYSIAGAQKWDCSVYGHDSTDATGQANTANGVEMNGYANGIDNYNVDWLISPRLDLTGTDYPLLSFWSRNAYAGDVLQLKISTDYTGTGDPTLAHWTDLNGKFPSSGSDTWTLSANINLSSYKQSGVYIAYVYTSTTDDGSRWDLDDIKLINSSTPPPPSLTVGATDLQFGYAASGTAVTKKIMVTGNDLTSDISLSTTSSTFLLSTDSLHFSTSITIGHDTASDIPEPVYVQFAPSAVNTLYTDSITAQISDTTITIYLKGNSIDPTSTLNIVDWNLNWFCTPDPTLGPTNKALQMKNVSLILPTLKADLYALQEVVNEDSLKAIVANMPGYAYIINNYGSYSNTAIANPDPLNTVQKLAFVYNTGKITPVRTDSLLSIGVNTAADTATSYYNYWASGRFPYMLTADVVLSDNKGGTITKRIHFIDVHAKANTAPVLTAYSRREAGAKALDSLIKADYPNDNTIILGDFNDDLNKTITTGIIGDTTSWHAFTIQDSALYIFPTKPLSLSGQHSDVSYSSVIDNVVASKSLSNVYLSSSATVLSDVSSLVSNYGTTTTDHYPVFTQFSFASATPLPVTLTSFTAIRQDQTARLSWSTAQESNSKEFVVERSTDNARFSPIGTVTAKGNSATTSNYTFLDEQPAAGNNYYRLQQVDLDGNAVYSKTLKLNFAVRLEIRPNPAHGSVTISLNNTGNVTDVMILDLSGKLLVQKTITAGTAVQSLNIAGLAHGVYTVKTVSSTGVTTQKLLVD